MKISFITLSLIFLSIIDAYSHDIWLSPDSFTPSKGDALVVQQLAGHELISDVELPLLRNLTPIFELITSNGAVNLLNESSDKNKPLVQPVLNRKLDFEGLALVTMEHDFYYDEFPNDTFKQYLEYEGLIERYGEEMKKRPKQRERYARTMKSLIKVGNFKNGDVYKKVLGRKAEIVLLQNPYTLKPGENLEVQVLFDGKPLPDQLVMAINGDGKQVISKSDARTDDNGIAVLTLDRDGKWIVRTVLLRPCSDKTLKGCSYADWESYWASYVFQLK